MADQRPTTRRGGPLGCGSHAKGITPPQADSCYKVPTPAFRPKGAVILGGRKLWWIMFVRVRPLSKSGESK